MDGEVLTLKVKSKTSGNAQVYSAEGGTTGIKEIQYSPSTGDSGSSKHKGEYYKITYKDGSKVKVVNPENYRPTFDSDGPFYDKNTRYINPQGQNVIFDPSINKWVSE